MQARYQRLLSALYQASMLLNRVDRPIDDRVLEALLLIGRASRASRVLMFKYLPEGKRCMMRHRWESEGSAVTLAWTPENIEKHSFDLPARWEKELKAGKAVHGPVPEFPKSEQDFLTKHGICSVMMVPVVLPEGHWGFISLDDLHQADPWLEANVQIMLNFGITMGHAKARDYYDQELLQLNQQLENAHRVAGLASFEYLVGAKQFKWSKEAYLMYGVASNEDLTGENIEAMMRPQDIEQRRTAWRNVTERQEPYAFSYCITTPTGERKFLFVKGKALAFQGDYKVVGTIQDITELRMAQQALAEKNDALEQLNKELDQFAYIVSHDLKAPLRAISNLADWAVEDAGGALPAEAASHLNMLKERVVRMGLLIEGVLAYSRAAREKTAHGPVNVHTLVTEVAELLGLEQNLKLDLRDLPVIETEKLKLQQVFSNLISNARKYGKSEAPEIKVWADGADGRGIWFHVQDNGPGIAPEFHEQVFQIFTMLEKPADNSTGIGLAIVKKIVEERGGKIALKSAPGEGACFSFYWRYQA